MSNMDDIAAIAAAVRAARRRHGLTQAALAAACGLSRQTIAQLEAGTFSDLGVRKVARVLARLGLSLRADGGAASRTPAPQSRVQRLFAARGEARRREALRLAANALRRLREAGVSASVVGSLAKGTFRADSDVDFLVEKRGRLSESAVGALLERVMAGFPFDVIFAEHADPVLLEHMREEARRGAPALRPS